MTQRARSPSRYHPKWLARSLARRSSAMALRASLRPYLRCGAKRKGKEIKLMPKIVKVIEILSESPKSWEEASRDGKKITSYRVNAKVTFEMERGGQEKRRNA